MLGEKILDAFARQHEGSSLMDCLLVVENWTKVFNLCALMLMVFFTRLLYSFMVRTTEVDSTYKLSKVFDCCILMSENFDIVYRLVLIPFCTRK